MVRTSLTRLEGEKAVIDRPRNVVSSNGHLTPCTSVDSFYYLNLDEYGLELEGSGEGSFLVFGSCVN